MAEADGSYTNEDFRTLLLALRRFADHELDQWVNWRLHTTLGDEVFVTIGRAPDAGGTAQAYDPVWPDMPLRGEG